MKKTAVLILTIIFFLTAMTAFAENGDRFSSGSDPVALIVDSHEVTQSELESAAVLSVFESALQCAGYGYAFDIMDPLNIEDEMDKLVFDLESWYVTQDLAASMGLYPPGKDAGDTAAENAEAAWEHYREIAWSDNGMAFLPAGDYESVEDDPDGNLVRYFASFGLTKEALLQEAIRDQTGEELKKAVTAFMTDESDEAVIDYYTDWFLAKMDERYIVEYDDVIDRVTENLLQDPSENQDSDGYEAVERSILIEGHYYTLGESTIRDFERNGWEWTQTADGAFSFEITDEDNRFYARTENGQADGKLVMVDLFYAYEISYEYLGIGFDLAFDPDAETDIWTVLEEIYGGEYEEDGTLHARTEVRYGTLLIETNEGALRLTLE